MTWEDTDGEIEKNYDLKAKNYILKKVGQKGTILSTLNDGGTPEPYIPTPEEIAEAEEYQQEEQQLFSGLVGATILTITQKEEQTEIQFNNGTKMVIHNMGDYEESIWFYNPNSKHHKENR